jgi:hypothetical protein
MEDVRASKELEDLARSYDLDVELEHIPLGGAIDLNRSSLIVICGPRLSDVMQRLYERDPVISWEKTLAGAWALRDMETGRLYVSGSDKKPSSETYDVAYLGRLSRPDGMGRLIAFTGIHPPGTLGVVHLLTADIGSLWEHVKDEEFSVVVGVTYDPETHDPVEVEQLTPMYLHHEMRP